MEMETIADIVAEMRSRTAKSKDKAWYDQSAWATLCDRIEIANCAEKIINRQEAYKHGLAVGKQEALAEVAVANAKQPCKNSNEPCKETIQVDGRKYELVDGECEECAFWCKDNCTFPGSMEKGLLCGGTGKSWKEVK